MKIIFKRVLAVAVVVLIVGIAFYHMDRTVSRKDQNGIMQMEGFYQLKKDSVDVLVIGSSHAYVNVNPAVWWREYGVAGYVLGGSAQPTWNSYYWLKEALKYQTPQVILLDVFRVTEQREYADDANVLENVLGMRPSYVKWQAIKASAEEEKVLPFFLGYPTYHDRYLALEKNDCYYWEKKDFDENFKGYQAVFDTLGQEPIEKEADLSLETELFEKSRYYLIQFIELCQEKNIPLVLINSPTVKTSAEDQATMNEVTEIAEQYGVPFWNGDLEYREMGIDSEIYFADYTHLNYWGSKLYTQYLGRQLLENFEFEDKRGNKDFESWEINAICEDRMELESILAKGEDLESYLNFVDTAEYQCAVICDDTLKEMRDIPYWSTFINQDKRDIYYTSEIKRFIKLGNKEGQIEEGKLIFDDSEYSLSDALITMVVYDGTLKRVTDVIYSDGTKIWRP